MPDKQKDERPSKPEGTLESKPVEGAPFVPYIDDPPARRPMPRPWRPRSAVDEVFPPPVQPPFFLDDHSSNIVPRQWATLYSARRAAILNSTGGSEALSPLPLSVETPSLLLQTVIVAGERTNDGRLIEAVTLPWFEIIALLQKDVNIAYQLSWEKWEEIIAGAYEKAGFDEVILTPRSGDHGRDVIAIKKALGTIRVIDQVKAYKPGHLVTGEEVSALWGVMQGDKASKGFLTTTSDFAPKIKDNPFIAEFIPSRLELINGKRLFAKLDELVRR
jgi:restriction system protein